MLYFTANSSQYRHPHRLTCCLLYNNIKARPFKITLYDGSSSRVVSKSDKVMKAAR